MFATRKWWNELRRCDELKSVEAKVQSLLTAKIPVEGMDRSPLAGKKRKNPPEHAPQQPTPKKSKKDNEPFALDDERHRSSEIREVEASLDITLPPNFIGNSQMGIQGMLDSMLMQYAYHHLKVRRAFIFR